MPVPSCLKSVDNKTSAPKHPSTGKYSPTRSTPHFEDFEATGCLTTKEWSRNGPISVSQLPTESSSGEHGEVAASCRAWLDWSHGEVVGSRWIELSSLKTIWPSHGKAQLFWYNPAISSPFRYLMLSMQLKRWIQLHEAPEISSQRQHMSEAHHGGTGSACLLAIMPSTQQKKKHETFWEVCRDTDGAAAQPTMPDFLLQRVHQRHQANPKEWPLHSSSSWPSTLTCRLNSPPLWMRFSWLFSLITRCSPLWSCSPKRLGAGLVRCSPWKEDVSKHVSKHVPRNPLVRPHSNNTSKQYDILVYILITRGWMKTLAIRSDFDFKFSGFRVLIYGLGFRFQGFRF